MDNSQSDSNAPSGRRSFLKKGLAVGATGAGIALLPTARLSLLRARDQKKLVVV
jgi:hypothetical protein